MAQPHAKSSREVKERFIVTPVNQPLTETVPIDRNIGQLKDDPIEIVCPSCQKRAPTKVKCQAVTCFQQFLAVISCCRMCCCCAPILWSGARDVNHFCSSCGCYIGRRIELSWYKRAFFRLQRRDWEEEQNVPEDRPSTIQVQAFQRVEKRSLDEAAKRQPKATSGHQGTHNRHNDYI